MDPRGATTGGGAPGGIEGERRARSGDVEIVGAMSPPNLSVCEPATFVKLANSW
jgi:hypothetical protein